MNRLRQVQVFIAIALFIQPIAHGLVNAPEPKPNIRQLLQNLTKSSADPCDVGSANDRDWQPSLVEMPLLEAAADLVTEALNTDTAPPVERAQKALENIASASAEINHSWPEGRRFQFKILDLKEILVVKMSIRSYERFFVFGAPSGDAGKQDRPWRRVGLTENESEFDVPWVYVQLYPLHRGPSGRARFLARSTMGGCAGSFGVSYDAREWNPDNGGSADQIIGLQGALGLDDEVKGFPQIGKLRTDGPVIDLPFCWWSPIDTWDNPSMCAVDQYDLSGNDVRFVVRRVNRPDLLPIVRAAEHAEKRDLPAVRAYCTSEAVARHLLALAPTRLFEVEIKVKQLATGRELVYEEGGNYRFVVEKRSDRWLIASFHVN
jgi:hypothetical protein